MKHMLAWFSVASLVILASCGGGGGDGGGGDGGTPAPPLPVLSRVGVTQGANQTLRLDVNQGTQAFVMSQINLQGAFNKQTHARHLDGGASARVECSAGALEVLTVSVNQAVQWTAASNAPTEGEFRVDRGLGQTVVTIAGGGASVQIRHTPAGGNAITQTVPWWEFDEVDIQDPTDPEFVRAAVVGYRTLRFLEDRIVEVAHHIMDIATHETHLQSAGAGKTFTFQGDYLPLVFRRGFEGITWTDVSEPVSEVGPGDNFTCIHDDMWVNDPAVKEDIFYDGGSIKLLNYWENATPVLLGFGTVQYQNLVIQSVDENPPGDFEFNSPMMIIQGELSITFSPA